MLLYCLYTVSAGKNMECQHAYEHVHALATLCTQNHLYADTIQVITSDLTEENIGIDRIRQTLDSLCVLGDKPLEVPASINSFPSLVLFLRERGLCHEFDTDLLCKLLKEVVCPAPYLKDSMKTYSDNLSDRHVLHLDFPCDESHSPEHFLAFTFHSLSTNMTLWHVYGMKDIFSYYLRIHRHSFSLRKANENCGSAVLVWQFPAKFYEHFITIMFGNDELRDAMCYHNNLAKVEVRREDEARIEMCRQKRKLSDGASIVVYDNTGTKRRKTIESGPCSSFSFSTECQEKGNASIVAIHSSNITSSMQNTLVGQIFTIGLRFSTVQVV